MTMCTLWPAGAILKDFHKPKSLHFLKTLEIETRSLMTTGDLGAFLVLLNKRILVVMLKVKIFL